MLETVGLTADESEVYRLLVATGTASAQDIAGRSALDVVTARLLLRALEHKGLASAAEDNPEWFSAVPPQVALMPRLQRHFDALEQTRAAVYELAETHRRSAWARSTGEAVEIITGAAALRQHLRQLQHGAGREMMWFVKAQYVAMSPESNQEEFDALDRGVLYRALYEQAYFDDPDSVDYVVKGVCAGEVARAVPVLPLRMAIADRSVAILPLAASGTSRNPRELRAAVVRESSLLDALIALFEHHWEIGAPLRVTEEGQIGGAGTKDAASPVGEDRHLLSLMVAGMTDEAIAGQLRVSKRTVQRRIQGLMSLAGVATRMQLGWHAARRDWL
ncbi:TrmB family transcriptional regulator [Streptomyces sp. NBC_00365]|uniref:helix-turn-helix domain-containing protein n=1 Tax=Streptomyces sp. NBC_00365 TaxID=2975726 RepID=UPI0022572E4F|nr:helix-turn-helix domain-containing protein [Streptomyces sp. NBC_00365]MCX5096039.1 TrmB family transcriptional regulator [Streptomyces sp. NBC_00365]